MYIISSLFSVQKNVTSKSTIRAILATRDNLRSRDTLRSPTIGKGPCRSDAKALAADYYVSQAMIFYSLGSNLILRNLRFSTSAPLVPSMALVLRSSAPLLALALALALAYLPLAQHSYTSDHVSPCH